MALNDLITENQIKPPRIVLYGPPKMGKSTFASQMPNPICLDFENGLDAIKMKRVDCRNNYDKAIETITLLHSEEHDFQTIAVDSADWLESALFDKLCKQYNRPSILDNSKGSEFAFGRGMNIAVNEFSMFLQGLTSLRDNKGMATIIIAHDSIKQFDDPLADSYDQHNIKLSKHLAAKLTEWADCLLFVRDKPIIKDDGDKKRQAGSIRTLYTQPVGGAIAGNRYGLPPELSFSWDKFIEAFNATLNKGE